jgi:hypothetical protein
VGMSCVLAVGPIYHCVQLFGLVSGDGLYSCTFGSGQIDWSEARKKVRSRQYGRGTTQHKIF